MAENKVGGRTGAKDVASPNPVCILETQGSRVRISPVTGRRIGDLCPPFGPFPSPAYHQILISTVK